MELGRQWRERLQIWDDALAKDIYVKLGNVELEGFVTKERLTLSQAKSKVFHPFPVGMSWGKMWEYAWVKTEIKIPKEAQGERIWIELGAGDEMLAYVNGREAGSMDKKHERIIVNAIPENRTLSVFSEVYAGHGPRIENGGIVRRDEIPVPLPAGNQVTVRESSFGFVDDEILRVYMDYHVLKELVECLAENDPWAYKVLEALKSFTFSTKMEEDRKTRRESILQADEYLRPLFLSGNSGNCPNYTVFGQSHIDIAWLWTVAETKRKLARTYSNQFALMERFPDYKFLACEPVLFEWMKEDYPELFKRLKDYAAKGQIIPDGAMYVESDVNLAGGECLIRQFVLGRRWFKEEFGVESVLAWLPDTFGFCAALPQIMKGCGVKYFTTQKLMRQDPEYEAFPYNDFWWEGLDGTKILSHIHQKNNAVASVKDIAKRWENDRLQYNSNDEMLYPFGYGDGGGGPTEEMLETIERCRDLEGLPKCRMDSPASFFERLEKQGTENVYYGELYLAWHRGTYTCQGEIKKLTRQAEIALREAEFLCGIARLAGRKNASFEKRQNDLYKQLLVAQFHDVLPGTSIEQVNIEARETLSRIITSAEEISEKLLHRIAGENAVFNSLSWSRRYRELRLPSCGFYIPDGVGTESGNGMTGAGGRDSLPLSEGIHVTETPEELSVKNAFYTAIINKNGEIVSLTDQHTGYELAKDNLNRFRLYENINGEYDAWEIASMYENTEVEMSGETIFSVHRMGDSVLAVIERKEKHFTIRQSIRFQAQSPLIDFQTRVDWKERHRILKVDFPTNIFTKEIISDIQFGYIRRPTHRSRLYEQGMYEICQHKYSALTDGKNGLALLNDCKYGISANDGTMSLTLLRAAVFPDGNADQGIHEFGYALMPFSGAFTESGVINAAYEYNMEPTGKILPGDSGHGTRVSYFETDNRGIVIETCKPAFDEENAVVLRIYESCGCAQKTMLKIPDTIKHVYECSMLEENNAEIDIRKSAVELKFRAFEIKTLKLCV